MATFRCAVHQITWERDLEKALDDIGAWGYSGTETFAYVVQEFAGREAEFKAMLDSRGLRLAALYSDDNMYEIDGERETIERNIEIVRFLAAVGSDVLVYGPGRPRPPRPPPARSGGNRPFSGDDPHRHRGGAREPSAGNHHRHPPSLADADPGTGRHHAHL